MGIELSFTGCVEPLEAATTARVARTDESVVSDWASILNCLFQIDQPVAEEPESDSNVEPQSVPRMSTSADTTFYWIQPPAFGKPELWVESDRSAEAKEISLTLHPAGTEESEVNVAPPEQVEGHELPGDQWTILPVPIALPPQAPTPLAQSSDLESGAPASPVPLIESSPVQSPHALPPTRTQGETETVEAAFRLSPETKEQPETHPSIATDRSTMKLENVVASSADPPERIGEAGVPRSLLFESRGTGTDSQDPRSNSDAQRDFQDAEPEKSLTPQEAKAPAEKTPFMLPSQPTATSESRQPVGRNESAVAAPPSVDSSAYPLAPDKRSSPLNLQLRITPDDLGVPVNGSSAEVRLNLVQRGDELLMKIQGGGEPVAARAEAEWGNLVERLKPHGIEATSRHFPSEFGRRDDEPRAPIAQEQATPDSGARQQEGQQEFQQEQHDRQQRQHRQRFAARVAASQSAFSLDHDTASPQGN